MPKIKINEIEYGQYGKCIEISNGIVNLVVTVDVGPRIIRFGFIDKENEFCENSPFTVDVGEENWRLMGGHRLWHSPENNPRTYWPDNSPVTWEPIENGIRVTQKTEPWVQIQKEMDITLAGCCNKAQVIHHLTNKNAWPVELSLWAITVMAPGGLEVIPQPQRETGLLPNRLITLWPYASMNDSRVYWGDKYITLRQDPAIAQSFKLGIPNEAGWAAYFNHGNLFIKKFPHIMNAKYPDFGVSYETYTTDYMLEMESLSPLVTLEPNETVHHIEEWELLNDVARPGAAAEDVIEKIVNSCIINCGGCR